MSHHESPAGRLASYLAGTANAEESARAEQWLEAHPDDAVLAGQVRQELQRLAYDTPSVMTSADVDRMAQRVSRAIRSPERSPNIARPAPARASWWRGQRTWGGMVGASLVVAMGFVLWNSRNETQPPHTDIPREVRTARGQRASLVLPGGVQAILAPETRLRYHLTANGETVVELFGQGHFTVPHADRYPFVVTTGPVRTRVLGTEFGVRHYPEDRQVTVNVLHGKVVSAGRHDAVTLTAGMVGLVTDSAARTVPVENARQIASWLDGRLVFRNAPVSSVLEAAGRWCGYEFQLADSVLAQQRVTTVLVVDSPQTTLALLKSLLNVRMTFDGKIVTLHPQSSSAVPRSRRRLAPQHTSSIAMETGK